MDLLTTWVLSSGALAAPVIVYRALANTGFLHRHWQLASDLETTAVVAALVGCAGLLTAPFVALVQAVG